MKKIVEHSLNSRNANASPESITELCEFYILDPPVLIARELAEFREAYKSIHSLVDVADLKLPRKRGAAEETDEMTTMQN
jgi:hypothetical protein